MLKINRNMLSFLLSTTFISTSLLTGCASETGSNLSSTVTNTPSVTESISEEEKETEPEPTPSSTDTDMTEAEATAQKILENNYIGNQRFDRSFVHTSYEDIICMDSIPESGRLFANQADFDNDGADEIFLMTLEYSEGIPLGDQYNTPNYLIMYMLEKNENEKWSTSAVTDILTQNSFLNNCINTNNSVRFDVFLKEEDSTPTTIAIECFTQSSYFSDGVSWGLEQFQYNNNAFTSLTSNNSSRISGSDIDPWLSLGTIEYDESAYDKGSITTFTDEILNFDSSITQIDYYMPIMEQDDSLIKLARIVTVPSTLSSEEVMAWMDSTEPLLATYTEFIDYTDDTSDSFASMENTIMKN